MASSSLATSSAVHAAASFVSPCPTAAAAATSSAHHHREDGKLSDTMKLDLFMLTFNCAKAAIDVGVFATHLHTAFVEEATQLPELVVLSLQEVAPLANAFIGGSFLDPYLSRFEEALNLAALNATSALLPPYTAYDTSSTATATATAGRPYSLVQSHNVGMTAILLFARAPAVLSPVTVAEVGFGAAEMGNKGAVGLRTVFSRGHGSDEARTELTFVATHLAAMEWNVARRNANWQNIMRALTFADPEAVVKEFGQDALPEDGTALGGDEEDGEDIGLLVQKHRDSRQLLDRHLHDLSVFKPSSHLFLGGDLNYRIATTPPPPNAVFPSHDRSSPNSFERFLPLDQLSQERKAGRTLHGMTEAPVHFPPTYKYKVLPRIVPNGELELDVPAVFAQHRYPSWTDRILYLDTPEWVKEAHKSTNAESVHMEIKKYSTLPLMRSSDHQAVFLRIAVPLVSPSSMAPPPEARNDFSSPAESGLPDEAITQLARWREDPRVRLPVGIEPEAWQRRKAGRRKEWVVGWGSAVWSTRQGALVLATILAVLGAIWIGWQMVWP